MGWINPFTAIGGAAGALGGGGVAAGQAAGSLIGGGGNAGRTVWGQWNKPPAGSLGSLMPPQNLPPGLAQIASPGGDYSQWTRDERGLMPPQPLSNVTNLDPAPPGAFAGDPNVGTTMQGTPWAPQWNPNVSQGLPAEGMPPLGQAPGMITSYPNPLAQRWSDPRFRQPMPMGSLGSFLDSSYRR